MNQQAGGAVASSLTLLALVLFAAVTPLLPTHELKADATVLSGLVLIAAVYFRIRARGAERSALDLPALAFLLVAVLATIFSVDPFVSFFPSNRRGEGLVVYIVYIAMALAAARLSRREVGIVVAAVVISSGLVGAIGLGQYFGVDVTRLAGFEVIGQAQYYGLPELGRPGPAPPIFGTRSNSTMGNPIFLGGYASLLLPLGIVLAVQGRARRWWGYAASSALLYGAMIGSQTRAAWVASAGAAILLIALLPKTRDTWRRLGILAVVFATITVIMLLVRQEAMLPQRAASTFTLGDNSLGQRLYLWKHTLPLIAQRPILGWGFSTLLGRFPDLGSREYIERFGFVVLGIDSPHNDLLHIAYSTGLLGLAAYLWVWATLVRSLVAGRRSKADVMPRLDVALTASLVAYAVWLQMAWTHVGPAHAFWTLGGVAVALGREGLGGLQ